jgi:N-terminal domain of reverse transcriptase
MKRWNHMGKLGTAVPDATAVMADLATLQEDGSAANGPEDLPDWDAIDWRHQEEQVRRLQQRIFKAEQAIPARPPGLLEPCAATSGTHGDRENHQPNAGMV